MKKLSLATLTLAAMVTFAACSNDTPTETPEPNDENVESTETNVSQDTTTEEQTEVTTETKENETTNETDATTEVEPNKENKETEKVDEEDPTDTTTSQSDDVVDYTAIEEQGQGYTVQILPAFTFANEEPNLDLVTSKEAPDHFMRIQTGEAGDYEYLVDNTIEMLKASANVEPNELPELPFQMQADQSAGYQVQSADGTISSFVIQQGERVIRFTMFDDQNNSNFSAFSQMAQSIKFQ